MQAVVQTAVLNKVVKESLTEMLFKERPVKEVQE